MPRYEYRCENHSCDRTVFTEGARMAAAADPAPCPDCTQLASRTYDTPPSGRVKGGTPSFHGGRP